MYQKNCENGYIVSLVKGVDESNITEDAYNTLLSVIAARPADAPAGYRYRLREDMTWELCVLPEPVEEDGMPDGE